MRWPKVFFLGAGARAGRDLPLLDAFHSSTSTPCFCILSRLALKNARCELDLYGILFAFSFCSGNEINEDWGQRVPGQRRMSLTTANRYATDMNYGRQGFSQRLVCQAISQQPCVFQRHCGTLGEEGQGGVCCIAKNDGGTFGQGFRPTVRDRMAKQAPQVGVLRLFQPTLHPWRKIRESLSQ